ncbi:hypothetical protein E4U53_004446, partial [Claviceps sorghi]
MTAPRETIWDGSSPFPDSHAPSAPQPAPSARRSTSQERGAARDSRPATPATPADWPLGAGPPVQQPRADNEVPGRTGTAFSEANTLVRSSSGRSRSSDSVAKHGPSGETGGAAPPSLFPTYDPAVPLAEQHYAPRRRSPTRLPRAVISRRSVCEGPASPSPGGQDT